jgi:hypothetical protein
VEGSGKRAESRSLVCFTLARGSAARIVRFPLHGSFSSSPAPAASGALQVQACSCDPAMQISHSHVRRTKGSISTLSSPQQRLKVVCSELFQYTYKCVSRRCRAPAIAAREEGATADPGTHPLGKRSWGF